MSGWRRILPGEDISEVIGTCICCDKSGRMGAILYNSMGEDPIAMCKRCFSHTEDVDYGPEELGDQKNLDQQKVLSLLKGIFHTNVEIPEGSVLDDALQDLMHSPHPKVIYWAAKVLINCSDHGLDTVKGFQELSSPIQDAIDELE